MLNFDAVQLIEISSEEAGQRLDNYLIKIAKGVPKSRIYRAIRKGEVRINKKRAEAEYKLRNGDVVRVPPLKVLPSKEIFVSANTQQQLLQRILYEDANIIVSNKPAGLPVHGGTNSSFDLVGALRVSKPEYKKIELVHRLDKGTSGCLLLAKKASALRDLQQQLREHSIEKNYLCLVKGKWRDKIRHVREPLRKNVMSSGERIVRVDPTGKVAHTEFHAHTQYANSALIEARLHTGRTHQIRVHLQHIGHPLAGDEKYGNREFNKQMKQLGLQRMFLHAYQLKFCLPGTEKAITVTAPLDDGLQQCLENLPKPLN